jgi:hypothetical protein
MLTEILIAAVIVAITSIVFLAMQNVELSRDVAFYRKSRDFYLELQEQTDKRLADAEEEVCSLKLRLLFAQSANTSAQVHPGPTVHIPAHTIPQPNFNPNDVIWAVPPGTIGDPNPPSFTC